MTIRSRLEEDDQEWLRLRSALWPELSMDEHFREMHGWRARTDGVVLVALRTPGSGLAGFAEVGARSVVDGCATSPVAYLEGWYVDIDMRRKGIGAALVRAAETWAREHGFTEFGSDAVLANIEAHRAHEAVGFKELERLVIFLKAL